MKLLEINKSYGELAQYNGCPSFEDTLGYRTGKLNEFCVDIGNGQETDAIRIAQTVGKGGFVYSINISDDHIEERDKANERADFSNIAFLKCSPEKLTLDNEIANLVISNCAISLASDKQSVLNEIYRILKKGGRFVISDIYLRSPAAYEYKIGKEAISEVVGCSVTRDEYLNQLERAGFSTLTILEETTPYPKGGIMVANWTISGEKPMNECDWCN